MRFLKETTDWSDSSCAVPNHTYIVEDGRYGRLLGYIPAGTNDKIMFSKPMRQFDRRFRTFKEIKGV
jgi:hypothetical protein